MKLNFNQIFFLSKLHIRGRAMLWHERIRSTVVVVVVVRNRQFFSYFFNIFQLYL